MACESQPNRCHAVAFDLDSTPVDSVWAVGAVLNGMRTERGVAPLHPPSLATLLSKGVKALVYGGLDGCTVYEVADVAEFRERYAIKPPASSILFPGALRVLEVLRNAGHELAICTNKLRRLAEKVLRDTGLATVITVVVAGGDAGVPPKPAPAQLEHIANLVAFRPGMLAFVGDSSTDQLAAQRFGADFYLALYGYATGDEDRDACRGCFSRMSDLPALLGLINVEVAA